VHNKFKYKKRTHQANFSAPTKNFGSEPGPLFDSGRILHTSVVPLQSSCGPTSPFGASSSSWNKAALSGSAFNDQGKFKIKQ